MTKVNSIGSRLDVIEERVAGNQITMQEMSSHLSNWNTSRQEIHSIAEMVEGLQEYVDDSSYNISTTMEGKSQGKWSCFNIEIVFG